MFCRILPRRRGVALRTVAAASLLMVGLCVARVAPASAAPFAPAFPRLAVWWPNNDTQPASARARCDWVVLQAHDGGHIAELRAANPGIKVFGSTNARELSYVLDDYDDPLNVELRSASTDWILTQVGSVLTGDVTTMTTSIPVADPSRFAAGEMALVDHELVYIDAIHGSVLTVRARGPVDPPSSHAAGARIASVVTAWPGQITFDLSTGCPKADVGFGPETWRNFNVRRARGAIAAADWDGLFVDALETDPTWMVRLGRARSVDPLRTNRPVTDDYAAFDASWSAGAMAYGDSLRAALGDLPIVGNGNVRNFELNGTVFEDYPYADLLPSTWRLVFVGPFASPHASYTEWIADAFGPPMTLVQTYGSSRDYRAMRFGLCSALMNDGYFSYEVNGTLHAAGGLDWFDEYDNAGAGRGYLGQPTGSMTKVGNAYRRDYDNGIAIVNPSAAAVTVQLGGTFRKIKGKQDPAVDSGALVDSVTIRSRDGIVLLRVPSVGLTASDGTVAAGQVTTLQAGVAPAAACSVRIEQRAAGTSAWRAAGTLPIDASGTARILRSPVVSTQYRAVLLGAGVVSRTVQVSVRPVLALWASSTAVRRGAAVTLRGTVSGGGISSVTLQREVRGVWRTVRTVRAAAGRFRTAVSLPSRGTYRYRVRVYAASSHLAAASGTVRIVVR